MNDSANHCNALARLDCRGDIVGMPAHSQRVGLSAGAGKLWVLLGLNWRLPPSEVHT